MERSEDGVGRCRVLCVLGVISVSGCAGIVSCEAGLPLSVLVLLEGEWLYSGMLVSGSTLLLAESSVCMQVWPCSWPYLLGG